MNCWPRADSIAASTRNSSGIDRSGVGRRRPAKRGQALLLTTEGGFSTVARMARRLRVEYPGAVYHAMSRGDRREPIFHDDRDREQFLATLGEACQKAD